MLQRPQLDAKQRDSTRDMLKAHQFQKDAQEKDKLIAHLKAQLKEENRLYFPPFLKGRRGVSLECGVRSVRAPYRAPFAG